MPYPFSNFNPTQTEQGTGRVLEIGATAPEGNSWLTDYLQELAAKHAVLKAALRKSHYDEAGVRANELDAKFDESFRGLKNVANAKASVSALGDACTSAAVLVGSLKEFGWNMEQLSRAEQLSTMGLIIEAWGNEEMLRHIRTAGLALLYSQIVEYHEELLAVEKERDENNVGKDDIPALWDAKRGVTPLLGKVYRHVADYADLGNEAYKEIKEKMDRVFEPITVQVKSKETRNEPAAE